MSIEIIRHFFESLSNKANESFTRQQLDDAEATAHGVLSAKVINLTYGKVICSQCKV